MAVKVLINISGFFENISRKLQFPYNMTTVTGTLHQDQYKFMITSRSVLLRARSVSDKSCREKQRTFFPSKIVPFMRLRGKMYRRAGDR